METRDDLDKAIAALPDTVATAVTTALKPVLQPAIDKMNQSPTDFTPEINNLGNLGPTVATAVATAVNSLFNPPPPETGSGGSDSQTPS